MNKNFYLSVTLFLIGLSINFNLTVTAQGVGINPSGNMPHSSAGLDVDFNNKGTLITRMTTAQRNTITSPAEGLLIFNTTTKCFEYFAYGIWQSGMCASCPSPAAPTAGTHIASQTQIVWNWNTVSGATGYKWNTANSYSSATDNGASTSFTQTGLTCNTSYTIYVWAYNVCGNSTAVTLTQTTSSCPWNASTCTAAGGFWGATQLSTPNDQGCWFATSSTASCTDYCATKSLQCMPGNWNLPNPNCTSLGSGLFGCKLSGCAGSAPRSSNPVRVYDSSQGDYWCEYRFNAPNGNAQDCNAATGINGYWRICVCQP